MEDEEVLSAKMEEEEKEEELPQEEKSKNIDEPTESCQAAEEQETEALETVSALLSAPETAPSVTPERKSELLLQARADRVAWIQSVPLPYRVAESTETKKDPWSQQESLALLKNSNAVERLSSVPRILSSMYDIDDNTTTDVAERVRSLLEPLGTSREDCQLATSTSREDYLSMELASVDTESQKKSLLESYRALLDKLESPESATLVHGMRTFVRTLPDTGEAMASALRSYLSTTFEAIKSHVAWKNGNVDDGVRHALESFLYGHCYDRVLSTFKDEQKEDKEFLDRLKSLQFVTPKHLEVSCLEDCDYAELLQEAVDTLLSVDSYFSPYEKLQQVLKVYHGVNEALTKALNKDDSSSQKLPSADDVLPTLILTILGAQPENLVSTLRMIEVFCPPEYLRGEAGYAYTNLYGAFQFLGDVDFEKPDSLHINPEDFRKGLEECRASAKSHLEKVTAKEQEQEEVNQQGLSTLPQKIPVSAIRAARLNGETVDLEWAKRWQAEHGVASNAPLVQEGSRADGLPDSLPSGFSRSYSFMVTRPEDVRISELPQLLSEYRMLVHTTEQLIAERTTRLSTERKQKFSTRRKSLLEKAAELDLQPRAKSKPPKS